MYKYPYFALLTTIGFLIELSLAAVILWKHQERTWPSVLALCVTDLLADTVLSHLSHSSRPYFYAYYTSYFLDALLRLWVLHDVLRSFAGPSFTQQFLHWVTAAGGAVMAAGCWCMAAVLSGELPSRIRLSAIYFDRCVSVAWAGFIIAGFLAIAGSRLAWSRSGAWIAFGLSLRIASGMAVAGVLLNSTQSRMMAVAYIRASTALFVLLVWLIAVVQRPKIYPPLRSSFAPFGGRRTPRLAH